MCSPSLGLRKRIYYTQYKLFRILSRNTAAHAQHEDGGHHAMSCLQVPVLLPRLITRLLDTKTREDRGALLHHSLRPRTGPASQYEPSHYSPRAVFAIHGHKLPHRWTCSHRGSKPASSISFKRIPSTRSITSQWHPQIRRSLYKRVSRTGWQMHNKKSEVSSNRTSHLKLDAHVEPVENTQTQPSLSQRQAKQHHQASATGSTNCKQKTKERRYDWICNVLRAQSTLCIWPVARLSDLLSLRQQPYIPYRCEQITYNMYS